MPECTKCSQHGYIFHRTYEPAELIEGHCNSPTWIIGLNPGHELGYNDNSTTDDLKHHLTNIKNTVPYFRDFRGVSPILHQKMGEPNGVAHVDIVKCSSKSFPTGKVGRFIVENCKGHLHSQIQTHKPKILVCNGAAVSDYLRSILTPNELTNDTDTSYYHVTEEYRVCVVLSGFIGRIDRFARRRLGIEIEKRMAEIGLDPSAIDDAA